jgi:uncharacterized protein YjbJ (UPF0337 family)
VYSGNPPLNHALPTEHVKGAADKAKGAIEETAGKMMGDTKLQAEGKMDKAKGAVHNAVGREGRRQRRGR